MPEYDFYCKSCKKTTSQVMSMDELDKLKKYKDNNGTVKAIKCSCGGIAKKKISNILNTRSTLWPVAITQDGTAIDKNGNKTDNPYKNDPKGWRAAGKKIPKINSHNKKVVGY
jgi:hypothetical protein